MSTAFLKNETADAPVMIPARAPLPAGVINYVTPRGLDLLRTEREQLEAERAQVQTDEREEGDRSRQLALLNGRLASLNSRIATAFVVYPGDHPDADRVHFGATVTLQPLSGEKPLPTRTITIVGVDEADIAQGLVAFTAPLVRGLQGKKVGESVVIRTPKGEENLRITAISY